MPKITLDQFISQWNSKMPVANRLDFNIMEFTTKAGDYSRRYFQMSFAQGGFYASGNKWKPRESRWGKKFTHPIMIDTSTLKDSIQGSPLNVSRQSGRKVNGRTPFSKIGATYNIHTNENTQQAIKGKRGLNKKAKGYAAIHNTDSSISPFTVNQYSNKKPVQRQFIGFSSKLDGYINSHFIPLIFKGLPL